ncbi:MAG: DUF2431 domain-containing protein [Gammaproteobacteria bacterium]|nr:DUF2431 domain-containing protein [Gammaproteobacteria bacterium]
MSRRRRHRESVGSDSENSRSGQSSLASFFDSDDECDADHEDNKDVGVSSEEKVETRTYRRRLILGDGDFSYAYALVNKHPEIAAYILVTEIRQKSELEKIYGDSFKKHYQALKEKKVKMKFGVDATRLPEYNFQQHYRRIHFNAPQLGVGENNYNSGNLQALVQAFFLSAAGYQQQGDKVYMALPKDQQGWMQNFRYGFMYRLYEASFSAGYQYVAKRKFKEDSRLRYGGYKHKQTSSNEGAEKAVHSMREYIFKKVGAELTQEEYPFKEFAKKLEGSNVNYRNVLGSDFQTKYSGKCVRLFSIPDMSTDSESSNYSESDSEGTQVYSGSW